MFIGCEMMRVTDESTALQLFFTNRARFVLGSQIRIAYVPQIISTDQNIRLLFKYGLHATDYLYKPEYSVAPLIPTTNAIEHQLCGAFYQDLQLVISTRMPTAKNLPYYCPKSVEKASTVSTPAALEANTTGL
ncbi:hypothetical protein Mapa_003739 [Marchantia paleacea]|nr:hypothetical protein Mapa_003739 [Marchantia paleacea]